MDEEKATTGFEMLTIQTIIDCQREAWETYVADRTEEHLMKWRNWGLTLLDTLTEQQRRIFLKGHNKSVK